jgi:sialic acid synthase SpsE
MKFGPIDTDQRVLIVAEIGNNHEGSVDAAFQLIEAAAAAGVDAVKFQTFQTERFVRKADKSRFDRLKSFELPQRQWRTLSERARSAGLLFFSTPLDLGSADLLREIVDAYKVASGDLTFFPLIERVASMDKPVIMSSGLADLVEIHKALECAQAAAAKRGRSAELAVLHCLSAYPAPPEEVNLLSIPYMAERLPCSVGYSDHVPGVEAAVAAAASGARIVEKHFTLDKRCSSFRDHQLSADPTEMKDLVRRIRLVETMRGRPGKMVQPCEANFVTTFRRSIAASGDLKAGRELSWGDLSWLRPGDGLAPGQEGRLVGRRLVRDVSGGANLTLADVE